MTKTKAKKAAAAAAARAPQPPAKTAGKRKKRQNKKRDQVGQPMQQRGAGNLGAVVGVRLSRLGMGDIRRQKIAWLIGFTYVGDAAHGGANNVYFVDAAQSFLIPGAAYAGAGAGWVPIVGSDTKLGATYVSDFEKHFARKVIHGMVLKIESLNPATSNNMVAVFAAGRGGNLCLPTTPVVLATAGATPNTLTAVSSVRDTVVVESYATKIVDISHLIAGGSGAPQNEFEIQGATKTATTLLVASTAISAGTPDLTGIVPTCLAVAGNSTTAGLQGTYVHQVVIEQEVSFLDFIGGMAMGEPID